MRLVFDTNVYVSAFVVPGSKSDLAFRLAVRGAFELAVSAEILAEVREKLSSKFGFSEEEIERVERVILGAATSVEPEAKLHVLEDEPDNRILECALAAGAAAIVTGDRHLLDLNIYEGVGIMPVADLLYSFPA
ncbi:putative toxin-antitoxin system toxin component, PIN family [soil metagenome]